MATFSSVSPWMARDVAPSSPEPGGDDYLEILKTMDRQQILEVLSDGFCSHCLSQLKNRSRNLLNAKSSKITASNGRSGDNNESLSTDVTSISESESYGTPEYDYAMRVKRESPNSSPASVNNYQNSSGSQLFSSENITLNDGLLNGSPTVDNGLSEEQKERIRFSSVGRKKNFSCVERVNGKSTNVLEGLELHTKVFNAEEQKKIVECVYNLQKLGRKGQLRERTYSEPLKWMRGKGRITMQFGCCYNYAVDKNGNPPGIIRDEEVDPLPPIFMKMIQRMVRWQVLPPTCIPNSCIVNIYDEGDCIPPHIDHHDFVRPFCTASFLTESNILFGSNLKIVGPGEFSGPASIPLPVGSVLILNGNGADIAKHCIPGVPARRISITFRKMDDSKLPYKFSPEPELLGIKPLTYSSLNKLSLPHQQCQQPQKPFDYCSAGKSRVQQNAKPNPEKGSESGTIESLLTGKDDFPPLGSSNFSSKSRAYKSGSRK